MKTRATERPIHDRSKHAETSRAFSIWMLMPIASLAMGMLCLWMGALMSVRCERAESTSREAAQAQMASVTVERSLLGLIPISKTTLSNVVGVVSVHGSSAQAQVARPQIDAVLTLRLADGRVWNAPPTYAPFGTPPWKMAKQISQFIDNPSAPPLSFWCVSWMLHLAAVPFLLVGVFSGYFGVRSLIRLRSQLRLARGSP
ncbi:MAG: hypothetical protein ABW346_07790 [Terrimicrobium sp.]|jgi:hypothetical protein